MSTPSHLAARVIGKMRPAAGPHQHRTESHTGEKKNASAKFPQMIDARLVCSVSTTTIIQETRTQYCRRCRSRLNHLSVRARSRAGAGTPGAVCPTGGSRTLCDCPARRRRQPQFSLVGFRVGGRRRLELSRAAVHNTQLFRQTNRTDRTRGRLQGGDAHFSWNVRHACCSGYLVPGMTG